MSESASELIPPYYQKDATGTNKFKLSELEQKIGIIPPELKGNYRELEVKVSQAFVKQFGTFLNPDQKKYFEGNQVIFTDPKTAAEFEGWDEGILSVDPEDGDIGGFIYTQYSIGDTKSQDRNVAGSFQQVQTVQHLWAGRFSVFPLDDDQISAIEPRWLMSEAKFEEFKNSLSTSERFAAIEPFVFTNHAGKSIVHDKVHGIQDFRISLPILEASANYYQKETGKASDWEFEVDGNLSGFADLYGECVDSFGEDVHRLIFGNIDDKKRRKEVLDQLKSKFTPEKIDEISMKGFIKGLPDLNIIHWEKTPTAEVRKIIESKNKGRAIMPSGA